MEQLNQAQQEAAAATEGPLLIISCPGSGKTTTLLYRIREMVKKGIPPSKILTVTFTNAAASGMRERYAALFGSREDTAFLTIHSLCFGILRARGLYAPSDILREEEKRSFFYRQISSLSFVSDPWEMTAQVMNEICALRGSGTDPARFTPKSCDSRVFDRLLRSYDDFRDRSHKLDYDDMLVQCRQLLMEEPETLSAWQARFTHIQCDEYQDTNAMQRDILCLLAGRSRNLCVVGDDDQSIYMFRGASPIIMLSFDKDFPDCKVVRLDTNYRSGQEIVDRAGLLIARNSLRFPKAFLSDRGRQGVKGKVLIRSFAARSEELTYLAATVKAMHGEGVPFREMAILFRTGRQAAGPAALLEKEGIPLYSTESVRSFYSGWIFRCVRSYLDLALGRGREEDLLYVLNRPGRYLKEEAFRGCPFRLPALLSAAGYLKRDAYWKYKEASEKLTLWTDLLGPGKLKEGDAPGFLFQALTTLGFEDYLTAYAGYRNLDPSDLLSEFRAIRADALSFPSLGDWISYAREAVRKDRGRDRYRDEGGLVLTTMHKAKGLEWQAVFVIDVNEGLVPHRNAETDSQVQEERRLLYVAMTRAKDALYILSAGTLSPFLTDLQVDARKIEADRFEAALKEGKDPLRVLHRRYGQGLVIGTVKRGGSLRLKVEFPDRTRLFPFPDVFTEGYLTWDRDEGREPF